MGLEWWKREKAREEVEEGPRRRNGEGDRKAERDGATGSSSLTIVANP